MVYRRDILKAGLLFLTAPALGLPAFAKQPRRFIDVHCHFFNAADIPIRGFLQRVVLSDYAANKALAKEGDTSISLSIWKGMLAKLADLVLKHRAPTAREEIACLRNDAACTRLTTVSAKSMPGTKSLKKTPKVQSEIAEILQQHYQAVQSKSAVPSEEAAQRNEDVDAFVDYVLAEMKKSGAPAPVSSTKSMRGLGSSLRHTAESIAQFITTGGSFFSRYFDWAQVLTDYRENIAATYYSLYDTGDSRLVLSAPALVDYNYWLEDQSPSKLEEQVELMGLLSLRTPHPMHGYVAFDPLRAVRQKPEERAPLDIVKDAITKHGFLGVKLYSPMGFKPTGNADHALVFPAHASLNEPGFGEKLDRALDSLYAWCDAEEVPILAHTTESQSAGPDFAARAEPQFWDKVLSKYPKLRLNLAHFGNFSQAIAASGNPLKAYARTWESEIGAFIKSGRYPHLYSDISYFYWVLEGSDEKQHIDTAKKLFEKYFDTDPNSERLMFGTDWNMTGKAQGAANYVANVEAFFRDVGLKEKQLDNLFYKNAMRFLGLDRQAKATARLHHFYEVAGKPFPTFA